jgi:membrane-associated phospholipid phosphatase
LIRCPYPRPARRNRDRRLGVVRTGARCMTAALLCGALAAAAAPAPAPASQPRPAPELAFDGADLGITVAGTLLLATGRGLLRPRMQTVPPQGLDPARIRFGLDRTALGPPDRAADRTSDWTRLAAIVYPPIFTVLASRDDHPGDAAFRGVRVQAEATLLNAGVTFVLKRVVSRPRPYTYRAEEERYAGSGFEADRPEAFESFPSGHSSAAWAGAMAGLAFLVTERPGLGEETHFANGVLAGHLAASTSLLRVKAGRHFPTDVVAGAALGTATGVAVALIHQDDETRGLRGDAWRAGLMGVGTGMLFALLFTPPTSPWVE